MQVISGAINKEFPFLEDLMLLFSSVTTAFNLALLPSIPNLQEPPLMLQKFKDSVKQDNKSKTTSLWGNIFQGSALQKDARGLVRRAMQRDWKSLVIAYTYRSMLASLQMKRKPQQKVINYFITFPPLTSPHFWDILLIGRSLPHLSSMKYFSGTIIIFN